MNDLAAVGTVAEIRLESPASRTPGEDAPAFSSLDNKADRGRAAATVGTPDVPGVDAHDGRAVAFEIPENSESLYTRGGRPVERAPIEHDIGSRLLLAYRHGDTRGTSRCGEGEGRGCESNEREHSPPDHGLSTPLGESSVTFCPSMLTSLRAESVVSPCRHSN